MKNKNLLTIESLDKEEILEILDTTAFMKQGSYSKNLLKDYILASCFFEPSTRTRFSFEAAMYKLDGKVISLTGEEASSIKKGETLFDTMKVLDSYVDIIVLRHSLEGSAKRASEAVSVPIINAGDGTHEHPSQALIDLFSIRESQGSLENLNIAIVGDLLHGRAAHSLILSFLNFHNRLFFVSPEEFSLPKSLANKLKAKGIPFSFNTSIDDIIDRLDVLYVTRIQKERFYDRYEYLNVKNSYRISLEQLKSCKPNLRVFHPLPRVDEIDNNIDNSPYAYYFTQAANGLYVRQALLAKLLRKI